MTSKRRVYVAIHYLDEPNITERRTSLGPAAYHWSILICPKRPNEACSSYDLTMISPADGSISQQPNPICYLRSTSVDPQWNSRLLGRLMIGKIPAETTHWDIKACFRGVVVPEREVPEENSVCWVRSAIRKLQELGLAEQFEVERFMLEALEFADRRHWGPSGAEEILNYTQRPL